MSDDVKNTWNACGEAFDRFNTTADSYSENIERPAIERLTGVLEGARALDLGCGSGAYSLWLAERGARVTGLDLSPVMIRLALEKARKQGAQLDLAAADISRPLPFGESEFDLVLTATALHYIQNLDAFMREVAKVLKPRGRFIASVLHPISTARFPVAGPDENMPPEDWKTHYFGEPIRSIETPWLACGEVPAEGRRIVSYHHTTSDYFNALTSSGLKVTDLCEPQPPADFVAKNADRYNGAMRIPVYLILKAMREE